MDKNECEKGGAPIHLKKPIQRPPIGADVYPDVVARVFLSGKTTSPRGPAELRTQVLAYIASLAPGYVPRFDPTNVRVAATEVPRGTSNPAIEVVISYAGPDRAQVWPRLRLDAMRFQGKGFSTLRLADTHAVACHERTIRFYGMANENSTVAFANQHAAAQKAVPYVQLVNSDLEVHLSFPSAESAAKAYAATFAGTAITLKPAGLGKCVPIYSPSGQQEAHLVYGFLEYLFAESPDPRDLSEEVVLREIVTLLDGLGLPLPNAYTVLGGRNTAYRSTVARLHFNCAEDAQKVLAACPHWFSQPELQIRAVLFAPFFVVGEEEEQLLLRAPPMAGDGSGASGRGAES